MARALATSPSAASSISGFSSSAAAVRNSVATSSLADDDVVAARSALDKLRDLAKAPAYVLSRAPDRRQKAVYAITRREVDQLLAEGQDLVERLGAKRAELRFVSWNLVDPLADGGAIRRQVESFLNREPYPEESGLRTQNDPTRRNAALAAWQRFATAVTTDAAAPVPALSDGDSAR
jgi:hypothetical protein